MSKLEFERRNHAPRVNYIARSDVLDIGAAASLTGIILDRNNTSMLLQQTENELDNGNRTNFLLRARHDLIRMLAAFDN